MQLTYALAYETPGKLRNSRIFRGLQLFLYDLSISYRQSTPPLPSPHTNYIFPNQEKIMEPKEQHAKKPLCFYKRVKVFEILDKRQN